MHCWWGLSGGCEGGEGEEARDRGEEEEGRASEGEGEARVRRNEGQQGGRIGEEGCRGRRSVPREFFGGSLRV